MNPVLRPAAGLALVLASVAAAPPQPATSSAPPARPQASAPPTSFSPPGSRLTFEQIDANHDGVVSESEYLAASGRAFDQLDTDSDGQLFAAEVAATGDPRLIAELKQADANQDGVVTREEHNLASAARFRQFDLNGHHQVTQAEVEAAQRSRPPQ